MEREGEGGRKGRRGGREGGREEGHIPRAEAPLSFLPPLVVVV